MIRMSRSFVVPLLSLALLICAVPALGQDKVPPEAYARVNAALVENHVLPRYRRLAETTTALADAADAFCAQPDADRLAGVRARFHDAVDAWMGVQHLGFGPVELFMRNFRLYFWPEVRGKVGETVRELLEAGPDALAPERFRRASVAVQGLPALEYLLYAGHEVGCALLVAITTNVRDMAAGIVADWRGGENPFAQTLARPTSDNPYFRTHQDATLAFFKGLHGGLQLIADVKLKPIVGGRIETARPELAESPLSGRALRNVVINLEALQALYLGEGGAGLGDLVQAYGGDAKLDPLLRKAFRMTIETARSIDRPLTEVVVDPTLRPRAQTLLTQVLALKQIVRTRLAAALDLTVGFNALDGD